jgi:putative membrane protein
MMGWGMGYGMHGFGGGIGSIIMVLFWVLIIVGIVYLVRNISSTNNSTNFNSPRQEDSAIDIAKKRYARGEIDREELDEIIKNLK